MTVAGINKGAVDLLNDDLSNFQDGFNFDKDAECVTKKLTTYIYQQPDVMFNDGYMSKYKYGINLRRVGYELTLTDEYKELINFMEMSTDDLPESFKISMRNTFI